jgi:SAM-dependent methyltransferase
MGNYYNEDLAYIHDSGHSDFALNAAKGLIPAFKENLKSNAHILDLGCGSGILEKELLQEGYQLTGIDYSPAMIEIARKNAPGAEYLTGSFFDLDFPSCHAVVSIGECINYLFDEKNSLNTLEILFRKIYQALNSGGLFIFDFLEPGQLGELTNKNRIREETDWCILNKATDDKENNLYTRELTIFRKAGELYNGTKEVHLVRLYKKNDIQKLLEKIGFNFTVLNGYGQLLFPDKHSGFLVNIEEGSSGLPFIEFFQLTMDGEKKGIVLFELDNERF